MTDALKTLFQDALADEPSHDVPAHEDIARGRVLRSRLRRRRVGAGVGVLVAAAVAFGLPSSPVSVVDGGVADGPRTTVPRGDAVMSPEVTDDPLKQEMWEAVNRTLPADVELVDDSYVYGDPHAPELYLSLERGGAWFNVSIWLQNARPDLAEFRPCSVRLQSGQLGPWGDCEEGRDDQDRWRASGRMGMDGITLLEGGSASVAVRWGLGVDIAEDGTGTPSDEVSLTTDEASRIADAVWSVGARHDADELVSGVDLDAAAATWDDIRARLTDELGLGALTPADPSAADPIVDIADPDAQTGTVAASYVAADGTEIDVILWQKDRLYDTYCENVTSSCYPMPGHATNIAALDEPGPESAQGYPVSGTLGMRGGLALRVGSTDPALEQRVSVASAELGELVPFL